MQAKREVWEIMERHLSPCSYIDERIDAMMKYVEEALSTLSGDTGAEGWRPVGVGRRAVVESRGIDASKAFDATLVQALPASRAFGNQAALEKAREMVSVVAAFDGSVVGGEISGTYGRAQGQIENGRPVYVRGDFRIAFNGVAWAITKHNDSRDSVGDADAIFAFVQDMAYEPYAVINQWRIARTMRAEKADRVHEGFVVDPHGAVLQGQMRAAGSRVWETHVPRGVQSLGIHVRAEKGLPTIIDDVTPGSWGGNVGIQVGDEVLEVGRRVISELLLDRTLLEQALRVRPQSFVFGRAPDMEPSDTGTCSNCGQTYLCHKTDAFCNKCGAPRAKDAPQSPHSHRLQIQGPSPR